MADDASDTTATGAPLAPTSPTTGTGRRSSVLDPLVDAGAERSRFGIRTRPVVALPDVEGLLAGVAEVDITPPPGMPKAGYSSQRPRRQRLPHPAAGPGHPPARGNGVAGPGPVRPARRFVGAPAPGGRAHRWPTGPTSVLAGMLDRRHPHPCRSRPVPRHRLLQPPRLQPGRLRSRRGPRSWSTASPAP